MLIEIVTALVALGVTFLGAVGVYIKKRLAEVDEARKENTELRVENAKLTIEKAIAKRAARNLIGSHGDEDKRERIRLEVEAYEEKLNEAILYEN